MVQVFPGRALETPLSSAPTFETHILNMLTSGVLNLGFQALSAENLR
jgi:hypothetical protein